MYQINVFYGSTIEEVIYNYPSIEEALNDRYRFIKKYFDLYKSKGIEPYKINDMLNVSIAEQEQE